MVQVIPKTAIKQISAIKKILPWFSFALVIIVVGLYFVFSQQIVKTEAALDQAEQELAQVQSEEQKELENKILITKIKTEDIIQILQRRQKASDFFTLLESLVHPKLYFTALSLNIENEQAEVKGLCNDFTSLGEQVIAFSQSSFIEEAQLLDINFTKEGEIEFSIALSLSLKEAGQNISQ